MCVTGGIKCACSEPAVDRDGWAGGEEAGVYHGSHEQTRSVLGVPPTPTHTYLLNTNTDRPGQY